MAGAKEFALDTPVSPPRVLSGQLYGQLANLIADQRASRLVRIGPLLLDQPPVPGQQRARRHDPMQPKALGQQPRQRGDHSTVGPVWLRADELTAHDGNLVPQHQDLHVLRSVAPREERQPAEQPDHEQIDKTEEHKGRG